MSSRLLVLSNGHGEDLIALRVIEALVKRGGCPPIAVLPLVGEGEVFGPASRNGSLELVGARQKLPSGGFSNQSLGGLGRDLAAGLPLLSWRQWQLVRRWGKTGNPVLAVGDLWPLLLASLSGAPFGFIGTPKSDYTWASAPPQGWGRSTWADAYHRCKGSEWDPWEWALMGQRRCRLVAVRDGLTARGLRRHRLNALAPGNPMMDGFAAIPLPDWLRGQRRILMLPGSRMPEALGNASRLLAALKLLPELPAPTTVLVACGSQPDAPAWASLLQQAGWRQGANDSRGSDNLLQQSIWELPRPRAPLQLVLGPGCFNHWAPWAELGLATAGTATEQLVGLGVPVLSLPGPGPQFKAPFARRQSRLLGGAVLPCHGSRELAERLALLMAEPALCQQLGNRGRQRMGGPGGSAQLAGLVAERLLASDRLG
ncbi:lipid-A-disaccharide synthase-related protein [Cyanobium sp. HWJ4-Hawea]|uniref:lipid-A-disaccharide synthase-related protein n=1 Tax=Cyanobium sp. HWJ4-Hawea TaxID=2823713 RepID=UPI0020CCAFBF|nr:lipid-A-disaccharide synthase-related protein [Cyanobium sp. HWJ4-Hawea]MCP9808331.1 lipid-A-disaccharide synthase-related protein [Cyanobium sp. HWJ4-Hawea]